MPSQSPQPSPARYRVIDPAMIAHVMEHPARQTPWSLRELAESLGCSHATLGYMRRVNDRTYSEALATKFAEAVGCETAVLFEPAVSAKSDTTVTQVPA